MTEDSGRTAWLQQVRAYLRDADPVLARLTDGRLDADAPSRLPGDLALRKATSYLFSAFSAALEPTG